MSTHSYLNWFTHTTLLSIVVSFRAMSSAEREIADFAENNGAKLGVVFVPEVITATRGQLAKEIWRRTYSVSTRWAKGCVAKRGRAHIDKLL